MEKKSVAIVGGRDFSNYEFVKYHVLKFLKENSIEVKEIVSGGASGVDTCAKDFADEMGYEKVIYEADWDRFGKAAGPKRNTLIAERADIVIAFWDQKSKGTKNCINQSKEKGKEVKIIKI